jgi:hypothetical protein
MGYTRTAWPRFFEGLALLGITQAAGIVMLRFVTAHPDLIPSVPQVRGWAIAAPLLIITGLVHAEKPAR